MGDAEPPQIVITEEPGVFNPEHAAAISGALAEQLHVEVTLHDKKLVQDRSDGSTTVIVLYQLDRMAQCLASPGAVANAGAFDPDMTTEQILAYYSDGEFGPYCEWCREEPDCDAAERCADPGAFERYICPTLQGIYRRNLESQHAWIPAFPNDCSMNELNQGDATRVTLSDENGDEHPDRVLERVVSFACSSCSHGDDHGWPEGEGCPAATRSVRLYDTASDSWPEGEEE